MIENDEGVYVTIFLAVIPTESSQDSERKLRAVVERLVETYSGIAGEGHGRVPEIVSLGNAMSGFVAVWKRPQDSRALAVAGPNVAVMSGTPLADELLVGLTRQAGRLRYSQPVWGMYACAYLERDANRFTAWNTSPALEGIHFGATDEFVAISNRPMLVALARSEGVLSQISTSDAFIDEYLLYGYSITGQTAFDGVRTLEATRSLVVQDGVLSFNELPAGLHSTLSTGHSFDEGVEALEVSLRNATSRSIEQIGSNRMQLRMSGGKDSRLLLGLFRNSNVDLYAATMGRVGDPEVSLAAELTSMAAVEHHINRPSLARGESLRDKVATTIARSDGQPPTEAHQAIYKGAEPLRTNDAITLGQWPLMKGGLANHTQYSVEEARRRLRAQGSWILEASRREPFDEFLMSWFDKVQARSISEKLYLFSREFRSGRWLQPQTALFARDAINVYPISDSEVTATVDALRLEDKVDESVYFGALKRIWPESLSLPLRGSVWAFEKRGPKDGLSGKWYQSRHRQFTSGDYPHLIVNRDGSRQMSEYSNDTMAEAVKELLKSPRKDLLLSRIAPELREVLYASDSGGQLVAQGKNSKQTAVGIWRLYCADVWLSKDWLQSPIGSPVH